MSVSTTTSECGQNSSGQRTVYSLCGMCAVRCPLAVTVKDGAVAWIQGNPNDPALGASLCAKGGAGQSFQLDDERPHSPLIRTGARGEGQWRRASWDEALTYIADKVQETIAEFGTRGIALSDRGGPFTDLTRTFTQALGSPNYVNHDASCASNVYNAARSLFGFPHSRLVLDLKRAKHLVLYGRNIAESLMVKEAKSFMAAVANGLQVTYIDPRATITASKASRYWQIRPNSDYALNLALIHEILRLELYDKEFVARHVTGLEELRAAVATTTPDWQVEHTGISAAAVRELVQDIAAAAPQVIFHPGWMTARHKQSFYVSRSALILNVLMGNLEVPGGLLLAKTPEQCGRASLKRLQDRCEKVSTPRADGAGDVHPSWDPAIGVLHQLYAAMETAQPYGIGAYFIYRHDPLTAMPDAEAIKRAFDHLKLIVAIDVRYSETAWYADVILPESTFLERANILGQVQGAVPSLIMRDQAITPRFDSRPAWWIFREILRRLGRGAALDFEGIEDIWEYQLEGVGVTVAEMRSQGVVTLAEIPPTARSQIPPT
ncbi:thiosulfate reductase, partial [Chromatium okenii]|uniref:molybdopterin-dependent oxidoreductase n=1 Tax=Chromatium okenii TaxID=61644 RepID=UPI001A9190F3